MHNPGGAPERDRTGGVGVETATVELKIPCQAEYIGVARLVILGVTSRTSFSYDEIEDLRLAVGEACTSAIDRAAAAGAGDAEIQIVCRKEPERLFIQVSDNFVGAENGAVASSDGEIDDEQGIGALLMEILVDEIHTERDPARGTVISMSKYLGRQ